jgi:hypothetical protein
MNNLDIGMHFDVVEAVALMRARPEAVDEVVECFLSRRKQCFAGLASSNPPSRFGEQNKSRTLFAAI